MSDDDAPEFKYGGEIPFKFDPESVFKQLGLDFDKFQQELAQHLYSASWGDYFLSPAERVVRDYTQLKNKVYVSMALDTNMRYRVERDPKDGSLWLVAEAPGVSPTFMGYDLNQPVTFAPEFHEQLRTPITHNGMKRLVFELIDMIDDLQFTEEAMGLMDDWTEE